MTGILHRGLELIHGRDRFAIDAEDDIALAQSSLGRRAVRIHDHDAAVGLELALLRSREQTHRQADAVDDCGLTVAAAAAIVGHRGFFLEFLDRDADVLDHLVAPDIELRRLAGLDFSNQRRQLIGGLDLLAVDTEDDVERLDAGFVGRTARLDRGHGRAARPIEAEVLGRRGRDFLNGDADATAADTTVLDQLLGNIVGHADRNREGDAFVTAAAAVDLRIDADHLTLEIEQRSTGIAGIDRDIGLDEGHVAIAAFADVAARRGADDPGGDAVFESEW